MSDTRQPWKPWRANTRTAASRIWRRLSAAACWRAVVAGGGGREAAGHRDHPRPADGQDSIELGEAQVVADGQAQPDAVRQLGDDDLVARPLGVGLAVDGPPHLDVEQVQLAVDGA